MTSIECLSQKLSIDFVVNCRHLTDSAQPERWNQSKRFVVLRSPLSGLLSPVILELHDVRVTPSLKSPKVRVQPPGLQSNTAPLCMTGRTSVGKRMHTLAPHPRWVKFCVLAEERNQTVKQRVKKLVREQLQVCARSFCPL